MLTFSLLCSTAVELVEAVALWATAEVDLARAALHPGLLVAPRLPAPLELLARMTLGEVLP